MDGIFVVHYVVGNCHIWKVRAAIAQHVVAPVHLDRAVPNSQLVFVSLLQEGWWVEEFNLVLQIQPHKTKQ